MENSPAQNPSEPKKTSQVSQSSTAETAVVVLSLLYFWPLGLLLMWLMVKNWTQKSKWIITIGLLIPIVFAFIAIFAIIALTAANPAAQLERAENYRNSLTVTPTMMFNQ